MPGMEHLGRMLLILGGVIVLLGLLLTFGGRIPFLGKLPGDIHIERENLSCSIPLGSSLLLSLALTVLINVLLRLFRR